MISSEGNKQILEICHDIWVQIDSPSPPAIILQIYVPPEDQQILESYRKEIIVDFLNNGIDSPYSHAAAYLMTYVAFEYYDSAYWKHLCEYTSLDLSSNLQQSLGMKYSDYAEYYGFHVVSDGNRYVGTLLFNAGIPKRYATKFFDKARSLYMMVHRDLSESSLRYLKTEVEDVGDSYASAGGQAKGVRKFMADLDYSSDLWKGVLTRIDQITTHSNDGVIKDLGALEESFKKWNHKPGSKTASSSMMRGTGLYLNTDRMVPYIHISDEVVDNSNPQLSINAGTSVCIGVRTVNGQYVTMSYDQDLDDEAILSGLAISIDGRQIFCISESKFIIFNSSGIPTQNLSKGTNYVLCDQDQEVVSFSSMNYFGDYAIYALDGLDYGDVISICGIDVSVGFKQPHKARWLIDEIDLDVKRNSEHILCLRSHPKIHIISDMSECLLYAYGGSELISKTHIANKDYTEYDPAPLLPTTGGYYCLVVRFGSIKFNISYALIPDFDIVTSGQVTTSDGLMCITIWDRVVKVKVSSDDFYSEFDLINDGIYTMRLRTNIIGYSFDRSPALQQFGSMINRHELGDSIRISTGQMKSGVLELNVFSKGTKLTGTRYYTIENGETKFSLGNLMYSLRNVFEEMTFVVKVNDSVMDLFTVREVFGVDVDSDVNGICLLTSRHMPYGRKAIITGNNGDESFEFDLKTGEMKDLHYCDGMELKIIDSKSGETIKGPIVFSNHGGKCKTVGKFIEDYALQKDCEDALCEARWKVRKGQYAEAVPYLESCVRNQYSPAYELYAFCMLNVRKDEKRYKEYLCKASKLGYKRSMLLVDLIEQFKL